MTRCLAAVHPVTTYLSATGPATEATQSGEGAGWLSRWEEYPPPPPTRQRQESCILNKNNQDHPSFIKGKEFEMHYLFNLPPKVGNFIIFIFIILCIYIFLSYLDMFIIPHEKSRSSN